MDEPIWLSRPMVEAAHHGQVQEHGGLLGLRDDGLFESALARPRHRWSFEPDTDLPSLAASYGFGLVKNHPFLDGNKRIGFVAMNMFLLINDFEIDAPEPEVIGVMLQVADGTLDEPGLVEWLRSVIVPFTL
jgi:death-on-curing protein